MLQGVVEDYQFVDSLVYPINYFGVNPQFASAISGDYRLLDRSAAIGAGRAVIPGIPAPREANPPKSNVDLGAYENSLAFGMRTGFGVSAQVQPELCSGSILGVYKYQLLVLAMHRVLRGQGRMDSDQSQQTLMV